MLTEATHQVQRGGLAAPDPLRQGLIARFFHQDGRAFARRDLGDEADDVLMVQAAQNLGLGAHAVGMRGIDGDLEDEFLVGIVGPDEQSIGAAAAAEALDHHEPAVEPIAWPGGGGIGQRRRGRFGRESLFLRLGQVVEEFARVAGAVTDDRSGGGAHHLLQPPSDPVHRAGKPQAAAFAQQSRQIERAVRRGAAGEDVIGDGTEGKHVGLRGPLRAACGRFWCQVELRRVGEVVLDVLRAGCHQGTAGAALAAAGDLPVGDLKAGFVAVGVADQHVLRGKAAMVEALAVGVGHRLADLAHQRELLNERKGLLLLRQETVEAERSGVVLEDERRAEFRLAVVEDTLDAGVFHALQHAELALRRAGEAVPGLRRGGAGVRVDAHPAEHGGGDMAGGEVLPVLALGQQFLQFVVADAPPSPRRTYACLLNGPTYAPCRRCIDRAASTEPEFLGTEKAADDPAVLGGAGISPQRHPVGGSGVDGWLLPDAG